MNSSLYEIRDRYLEDICSYHEKVMSGKMNETDYKMFDLMAHTLKDLCWNINFLEKEESSRSYDRRRDDYGYSGSRHNPYYPDYSYGRDPMTGRYSRHSGRIADLREAMDNTTDRATRDRLQAIIADMERD